MDTILTPIMDGLRVSLCSALENTLGGAAVCACTLVPGQQAIADWCSCKGRGQGCGMAWVRLDNIYPTATFPAVDTSARTCTSVTAAVLEVGVYRCQPVPGSDGKPPPPEAQTQATLIQADDAMAIHRAIICSPEVTKRSNLLGRYTPRGLGDCGGGAWTVTVALQRR